MYILVSSANKQMFALIASTMSLMKMRKSKGSMIEP